jgi:lysozyme family protein
MTFDECFKHVVGIEGGYVNDPHDPGGETKFGITKRSYPFLNIAALSLEQAKAIYKKDYWDKCRCDELPAPLNLYTFDAAVNQGIEPAILILQKTLGVVGDGKIGSQTIAAAQNAPQEAAALYMADRAIRYTGTRNFDRYGRGWMKRLFLMAQA